MSIPIVASIRTHDFHRSSLEALLQQSLDFNTANDLIDRATKPVQPV